MDEKAQEKIMNSEQITHIAAECLLYEELTPEQYQRAIEKFAQIIFREGAGTEWRLIETTPPKPNNYYLVTGGKHVYYGFFDGEGWMVENRGLIGNESDVVQSLWMRPSKETPPTQWRPLTSQLSVPLLK